MTRAVKTEVLAHEGARDGLVGLVNEADHLEKILIAVKRVERVEEVLEEGTVQRVSREPDRQSAPSFTNPEVKDKTNF
jgi:hypothetical protein